MDAEGDVILNVPIMFFNQGGGPAVLSSNITLTLSHVDSAGTATVLGTNAALVTTIEFPSGTGTLLVFAGKINISKVFGKSEKLRLRVQTTIEPAVPASNQLIYIGHDPANRTHTIPVSSTWVTSQLKILVPVRTNL